MQQTVFHGVPVMIFPVNGDQDFNAKRVHRYGNGIEMEFNGLTAQELALAIKELTENSRFDCTWNLYCNVGYILDDLIGTRKLHEDCPSHPKNVRCLPSMRQCGGWTLYFGMTRSS